MAETKTMTQIDAFRKDLTKLEEQFKMALPPQIAPDKFMRVLITAVQGNQDLLKADRTSLWAACMASAQDGLLPDGKEAALVMFGQKVAYMPMVSGILKKVRNSGELSSITSHVVCKNDRFRKWTDDNGDHIEHEPVTFGDRGEPVGVYALAKTKDGAIYIETLDKNQVESVKKMARSKSVWEGAFSTEMWRKTAVRRLSKRLPMSTDLEMVIQRDDALYNIEDKEQEKQAPPQTKSSRLSKIVSESKPAQEAVEPVEAEIVVAESEEEIPI